MASCFACLLVEGRVQRKEVKGLSISQPFHGAFDKKTHLSFNLEDRRIHSDNSSVLISDHSRTSKS